jgi:hypothetical protein
LHFKIKKKILIKKKNLQNEVINNTKKNCLRSS